MLEFVGREMPGVWTRLEELRAEYGMVATWPAWCHAPFAVAYPMTGDRHLLAVKLTMLAAWRLSKGIYRFDPTLKADLIDTPLDGAVPIDVLQRLPQWCIYLEIDPTPTWRGVARAGHGFPWSGRGPLARWSSNPCLTLNGNCPFRWMTNRC